MDQNELREARIRFMEKLVKAGWVRAVERTETEITFEPTRHGFLIFREIRQFSMRRDDFHAGELVAFSMLPMGRR